MCQNFFNLYFSSTTNALQSWCIRTFFLYWTENIRSDIYCKFCGTAAFSRATTGSAGKGHFQVLLFPSTGVSNLLPLPFPALPLPVFTGVICSFPCDASRASSKPRPVTRQGSRQQFPQHIQTLVQPLAGTGSAQHSYFWKQGSSAVGLAQAACSPFQKQARHFAQI